MQVTIQFTITPTRKNKDIGVSYKMVCSELYYRFTRNYGCSFRLHQGKQVQFRSTIDTVHLA